MEMANFLMSSAHSSKGLRRRVLEVTLNGTNVRRTQQGEQRSVGDLGASVFYVVRHAGFADVIFGAAWRVGALVYQETEKPLRSETPQRLWVGNGICMSPVVGHIRIDEEDRPVSTPSPSESFSKRFSGRANPNNGIFTLWLRYHEGDFGKATNRTEDRFSQRRG